MRWKCNGQYCPDRQPVDADKAPKCYTCGKPMLQHYTVTLAPPFTPGTFPKAAQVEPKGTWKDDMYESWARVAKDRVWLNPPIEQSAPKYQPEFTLPWIEAWVKAYNCICYDIENDPGRVVIRAGGGTDREREELFEMLMANKPAHVEVHIIWDSP